MKTKRVHKDGTIKLPGGVRAAVPPEARYVAQDADGQWCSYARKPLFLEGSGAQMWFSFCAKWMKQTRPHKHGWRKSLRRLVR